MGKIMFAWDFYLVKTAELLIYLMFLVSQQTRSMVGSNPSY